MSGCDCCVGVHVVAPRSVANRPGLPRLAYRVGTHGTFLASMVARLSSQDYESLEPLSARTPDDAAIAMLDGWAMIADVLTFYQERIANEGFLRTATERRSILELGRLVDWMLRPGISATAYLSFTVDPDPQDPDKDRLVTIPTGSRVQNVPDPPGLPPATVPALGQLPAPAPDPRSLPQTFETAEDLVARAIWSRLEPRRRRPVWVPLDALDALIALFLEGRVIDLKPGMRVVLDFGGGVGRVVTIASAEPDAEADLTIVRLLGGRQKLVAAIEDLVDDFLKDLAAPSKSAAELVAGLQGALARKTDRRNLGALADAVATAVSLAAETTIAFEGRGFTKLAEWASGLLEQLNALARTIVVARRLPLDEPDVSDAGAKLASVGHAVFDTAEGPPLVVAAAKPRLAGREISAVLGALRQSRSIPPQGRRALGRDPGALFGPDSDLAPQLLTTLDPRLGGVLYKAIEGGAVPSTGFEGASVLRVKCQPFGATAPLRAVTDARGIVAGSEEWPLQGEATLGVSVGGGGEGSVSVLVSAEVGDQSFFESISGGSGTVETPDFEGLGKATVSIEESLVRAEFAGKGLPNLAVELEGEQGSSTVHFTSDSGDVVLAIPFRGIARRSLGGERYIGGFGVAADGGLQDRFALAGQARLPLPPNPRNVIDLDAEYEGILPGSWIVIERPGKATLVTRVEEVSTISRAAYSITAKVTRLTLAEDWLTSADLLLSAIRDATVFVLSQPLVLALEPVDDDICGSTIELQRVYPGLESGRWIIVEGERTDIPETTGVRAAELAMIAGVTVGTDPERPSDTPHTTIVLANPLSYCYLRKTASIHGNVARATHGETREEVLGSGDASRPLQAFAIRAKPLTYLADASALGASSTMELRVDRLRWAESRDLVTLGPRDRRFILRTDDADITKVIFGTGSRGARPSTGQENVTARYRTGTGIPGNLPAGKITQLATRPLGVSAVVNPLPSTGGADRETFEQGRRNLPLGVLALDRLVSVRDYEEFTRARAGIGQASAIAISDGKRRVVHVTIAGTGDAPIDPSSDLFRALRSALQQAGDPLLPVTVAVRELIVLILAVNVRIADDRLWEDMEPVIRARLLERLGFEHRRLGQDVLVSEVQAIIQELPGVVYSDVDALHGVPEAITPDALATLGATIGLPSSGRMPVRLARFEESTFEVDGTGLTLSDVAKQAGVSLASVVALNPDLAGAPLEPGEVVVVRRGIRPAQIALVSAALPDTLILREVRP